MVKPLDTMLTQWVHPVLKPRGWRKKGRCFTLTGEGGDHALFYLQGASTSYPDMSQFYVEIGPITASSPPWHGALFGRPDSGNLTITQALWRKRLQAPEPVATRRPWTEPPQLDTGTWMIDLADPEAPERCGRLLADVLLAWAPTAEKWTNRKTLAAFLEGENSFGTRNWRNTGLVLVDDGPSPELDDIIAFARSKDDILFADWLTARALEHLPAGDAAVG